MCNMVGTVTEYNCQRCGALLIDQYPDIEMLSCPDCNFALWNELSDGAGCVEVWDFTSDQRGERQ